MGKPIPFDLRVKIVRDHESGMSHQSIADALGISRVGVKKLLRQYRERGESALKADYSRIFKQPKLKLEAGIKLSDVNTSNDLYATILQQGSMQPDTGRSNRFNYKENIYAAYANIGRQVKKFEFQLGLRLEHSLVKGISTDLKNTVIKNPDTSYLNLFPSAFLSYKINEKNQLAFSYGKRINRPDYQSLNPFETIYDIYTAEKGNPYLKPQYALPPCCFRVLSPV